MAHFKRLTQHLNKQLKKDPSIFTEVTTTVNEDGLNVYRIVVDSYAKKGVKFFTRHTVGVINSKITLSTSLRNTLKVTYVEDTSVRYDVIIGKQSITMEQRAT